MTTDTIQIFVSGLLSSGVAAAAAVFLFKIALEKRLEKEVERLKGGLNEELEQLKAGLSLKLEEAKSDLRIGEVEKSARFHGLLDFRARQLSDFYWPLYIGLQKDNVIWRRILDKRDAKDELRRSVGAIIEKDFILPNHDRLVEIIEKNLHLAEAESELEDLLLAYVRHVAVYKSIRAAGEEMVFPIKAGEEWPAGLFPAIETRLHELQDDYNRLLRAQGEFREDAV